MDLEPRWHATSGNAPNSYSHRHKYYARPGKQLFLLFNYAYATNAAYSEPENGFGAYYLQLMFSIIFVPNEIITYSTSHPLQPRSLPGFKLNTSLSPNLQN